MSENRPLLIILQSENDQATGKFFPIGTGLANVANFHYHRDEVPVPGSSGEKISENEFQTHTPGNDQYLVNFNVVPMGGATPPPGLKSNENRALEANVRENVRGRTFFTSEQNDGHEKQFCRGPDYTPGETRPPTGNEDWQRWEFVYSGNAHVPCWIERESGCFGRKTVVLCLALIPQKFTPACINGPFNAFLSVKPFFW